MLQILTPEIDQLIAVSRAIVAKIEDEGRDRRAGPPDLQRRRPGPLRRDGCRAARSASSTGSSPTRVVVGRRRPARAREGPPDAARGLAGRPARRARTRTLLVVGEGSRHDELERQAAALRIAHRVVFTGRRDDVPAVTAALDVAVLPSYREAQGLSILEAMALSRPVVASRVGGIPEVIEDGVSGLLVPPHDAAALAAAIVRLLTDHPFADIDRPGRPRRRPRAVLHRPHGPRRRGHLRRRRTGRADQRGGRLVGSAAA